MRIRFHNAKILSMEQGGQLFEGELWVEHGFITAIGTPSEEQRRHPPVFAQEIDAQGNLLLPGFKNAHGHAPMVFLRSFADDLPVLDWLEKQVFPLEAKLTEEQAYHFTQLAMMEYLSSGITASFEMYLYPHALAEAAKDAGFRTVLCGGVNDFTNSVEELESDFLRYQNYHPLLSMKLGFHAEYTTKPETIREIAQLASAYKAPVFTHLSESRREVDDCIARTGKTPTQYLHELGLWAHGGGGFHCVHMSPQDFSIFEEYKLWAVTNPGSNVKLASGTPKLTEMKQRGIRLALGTDGAGSNNALDFFREMHLATVLQKLALGDAAAFPANEVLHMATVAGAELLGLDDCDTLSVGKKADVIMINLASPNMNPLHNIEKNLVYSGSKQNVLLTMIDGKIRYHNGEYFLNDSAEKIIERSNKIVRFLLD